jgi:hypothetical protein
MAERLPLALPPVPDKPKAFHMCVRHPPPTAAILSLSHGDRIICLEPHAILDLTRTFSAANYKALVIASQHSSIQTRLSLLHAQPMTLVNAWQH